MKKLVLLCLLLSVFNLNAQTTQVSGAQIKDQAISNNHINNAAAIAWSKISKSGAAPGDIGAESTLTFSAPLNRSGNTISLLNITGGVLDVAGGGTGNSTFTTGYIPYGDGASPLKTDSSFWFEEGDLRLHVLEGKFDKLIFTDLAYTTHPLPGDLNGKTLIFDANGNLTPGIPPGYLSAGVAGTIPQWASATTLGNTDLVVTGAGDTVGILFDTNGGIQGNGPTGGTLITNGASNTPGPLYASQYSSYGEVRFYETGTPLQYVGFVAPVGVASNVIWTLPNADGNAGEVLSTSGAGVLSWTTAAETVNTKTLTDGVGTALFNWTVGVAGGDVASFVVEYTFRYKDTTPDWIIVTGTLNVTSWKSPGGVIQNLDSGNNVVMGNSGGTPTFTSLTFGYVNISGDIYSLNVIPTIAGLGPSPTLTFTYTIHKTGEIGVN